MAFNQKSKLPDTPWHVGFVYKDENDPRRHKARCIHLQKRICKCGLSGCYLANCIGSAHCKYYAEGHSQWKKYLEEMKTEEEKADELADYRASQYRKAKRDHVRSELESGSYHKKYNFRPGMIKCPFCGERLKELECKYCLAKFRVSKRITEKDINAAASLGYFLIPKK